MAATAQAQQYQTTQFVTDLEVAVETTNTVDIAEVVLTKYEDVSIQVSAKLTAAGTGQSTFLFARSANGVTYERTNQAPYVLHLTQRGTLNATLISNLNVGAISHLKCVEVGNRDGDGILTNVVITYGKKPQRFGK
jgi:hypothetical protein